MTGALKASASKPSEIDLLTPDTVVGWLKRKVEATSPPVAKRQKAEIQPIRTTVSEGKTIDMREDRKPKNRTDFTSVVNPAKTLCSVMTAPGRSKRLGSLYGTQTDVRVDLRVDAGRYGTPEVTLVFKINANKERGPIHTDESKTKTFEASWRPGVSSSSKWHMDEYSVHKISDFQPGEGPHRAKIYEDCQPAKLEAEMRRIVMISFKSNLVKLTDVDPSDWVGLTKNQQNALKGICYPTESAPYVYIWFVAVPNPDVAKTRWIDFLTQAVNLHLQPYWQYMNWSGQVVADFKKSPMIWHVGGGMYLIKSKKSESDNTQLITSNYHAFPLQTVWEMNVEFTVTILIPIVRDVQLAVTQASALGLYPHRLFLCQIRLFPGSNKANKAEKLVANLAHAFIRLLPTPSGMRPKTPEVDTWISLEIDNSSDKIGKIGGRTGVAASASVEGSRSHAVPYA